MLPVNEEGVFSLPTDSRQGGEGFFQQRRGIDTNPVDSSPDGDGFAGEMFQFFPDEIVVIRALGVSGDPSAVRRGSGLAARYTHHEDRPGGGVIFFGVGPGLGIPFHPIHLSLEGAGKPAMKFPSVGGSLGGGDTESFEAVPGGGLAKELRGV